MESRKDAALSAPRPYCAERDFVPSRSVPVTAIVLAQNEEPNIARCIHSLEWCDQVIVVDAESTDGTREIASACRRDVLVQPWLGFSAQRQWALEHPIVRNEWVYFVDADEWVSGGLAAEIERAVRGTSCDAFQQRVRVIFLGRWIRHCGWYGNSWLIRLVRRGRAHYPGHVSYGERLVVDGNVARLRHDLVDEDRKGLASWLRKHVGYAQLEAMRRMQRPPTLDRLSSMPPGRSGRPLARSLAKEAIFPLLPSKPVALFVYMYFLRAGYRDGWQGTTFCLLHAWHEYVINCLIREASMQRQ